MLATGKQPSEGITFHRKLLSEYNAEFTLGNYVSYFELKELVRAFGNASKEEEKASIETKFFALLQESYRRVKGFLMEREREALKRSFSLKQYTEEELRGLDASLIPSVFHEVRTVARYRDMNIAAFGKILRKFFERCAVDSPSRQGKIRAADAIISESEVSIPSSDVNAVLNDLCTMYGIVFKKSFEETMKTMDLYSNCDRSTARRVVPLSETYFFHRHFSHREAQGHFSMKIMSGRCSKFVCKMVCEQLQCNRLKARVESFANGEVSVVLDEAVRGDDVFVIQSMGAAPDISLSTSIMELALMLQTSLQNSAKRVTAVIPYIAYTKNTASVAAIAEILVLMGCRHVITVDLHKEQVEGMFPNTPVDNVSAKLEFIKSLTQILRDEGHDFTNICVVSPDSDTVARAHSFADSFMKFAGLSKAEQFIPICTTVKRVHGIDTPASLSASPNKEDFPVAPPKGMLSSPARGSLGTIDVVGNVEGRLCIIVDAVIDEAINITKCAQRLKQKGAKRIIAIATHAIFSDAAVERLVASPIDIIIISDSINQDDALRIPEMAKKLRIVSIAPLLAQAMQKVHTENTLTSMYEK
ncbi:ribose-phosphate pyrophosphokinase, putative [Bodo saltans]|uniref:Ribose-phosphate pyrophosphokinase, putative n=1 Tax=Bodo saltans TaxID=75058 RepID=A0A0S4IR80_BODSA|nr:ribose-phosphate pyrophosphokinase, putative [Bodo saltans]|eukprot:CUG00849.1 ribose-phosphate pyrophosphokinase, putative [Bodo saltans]